MAITTSLNPTLIVPSRLALIFVEDGLAPRWFGFIDRRTATPIVALTLNLIACLVLLISQQLSLALNIAVFALVLLYFIHSIAFLLLPRLNPELHRQITINMPAWLQRLAAWVSVVSMGGLILVQVARDLQTLRQTSLIDRINNHSLTSLELAIVWSLVGVAMYALARVMKTTKSGPPTSAGEL
jgi:amino acid transporter